MKRFIYALVTVALLGCLTACPNPTAATKTSVVKGGKFAVERLSYNNKSLVSLPGGDIQGPDSTLFFLKNIGDAEISDITISTPEIISGPVGYKVPEASGNQQAFVLKPSGELTGITLPVGESSVNQILRLDVNHGSIVGGVGPSDAISAGNYVVHFEINGKSPVTVNTSVLDSNGNPVLDSNGNPTTEPITTLEPIETLTVEYTVTVHSASWVFNGTSTNLLQLAPPYTHMRLASGGTDFTIINTGNSNIRYGITLNGVIPTSWEEEVAPGESSKLISFTRFTDNSYLIINSENTVIDMEHYSLYNPEVNAEYTL